MIQKYILDFVPESSPAVVVPVSQNDKTVRRFEFGMSLNGERFPLDGTQTVEFMQSNGAAHPATIENGNVFVDTFEDMTSIAGEYGAKLKFIEPSGGVIHSAAFVLKVEGIQ